MNSLLGNIIVAVFVAETVLLIASLHLNYKYKKAIKDIVNAIAEKNKRDLQMLLDLEHRVNTQQATYEKTDKPLN